MALVVFAIRASATLLGHWSFNGGLTSDEGVTATNNGAATTTGLDGSVAYSFDGDSMVLDASVTPTGATNRTICVWAQVAASDFNGGTVFYSGAFGDCREFSLRVHAYISGRWSVSYYGSCDTDVDASATADDGWHHLCLRYDGTHWAFFVDGLLLHEQAAALDTGSTYPLQLGMRPNNILPLTGSLDELYVYSDALTAADISLLHTLYTPMPTSTRAQQRFYV